MKKHGQLLKTSLILSCVFMMATLLLWGCGKSGSGQNDSADANASAQAKSTYSDQAMIGSSTGGSISVETDDGFFVTIDIPGKAMAYSSEVTLSVELENGGDEMTITISPSLALQASARLMIVFPDENDVAGKLICRKATEAPLKQAMEAGTVTATVYKLGEFSLKTQNMDDLLDAAYELLGASTDSSWQHAYENFDSLVWLSDYFSRMGYPEDANECFSGVATQSQASAELYLSTIDGSTIDAEASNTLEKYKHLMVLCENPNQIVDELNTLISQAGESD